MDLNGLPFQSPIDGSNVYYRRGGPIQNPRWTLHNSGQTEQVQRFFSSTNLSYDINDNVSVLYRLSIDNYSQQVGRFINRGGARVPDGELSTFQIKSTITDQILNVMYDYDINQDLSIDGLVGVNSRRQTKSGAGTFSTNQFVYGLNVHQNFIDHRGQSGIEEKNAFGVYATATLGYKYFLYLNLQARNDWTSTLEKENRTVLYPSVSLSFIVTDAVAALSYSKVLNYLKFRIGYGTSAGYPDPYSTRSILQSATNQFVTSGGTILNTNSLSNRLGNQNLTRELFKEVEAGIEAKMFNNILGIDLSLYQKTSADLIINLPLDPSTGFTVTTVNAAEVENKGIELGLDIHPPLPGAISWDITLNYTKNISKVNSIIEGIDQVRIAGYNTVGNYAIPGEPFGVLYGGQFKRAPDGRNVVDNQGAYESSGEYGIIGNPNPNYNMNWMNNISWKGLSFGFQFQYIDGGDIYSSTVQSMLARGNTSDTDVDRNIPLIMPHAVKQTGTDDNGDPIYVTNDIQTYIGDTFFDAYFGSREGGVFDATVIRLREISLGYSLPKSILDNSPFGRAGITISGENLWYSAPNFPKGINFDPEVSSLGVGNGRGFDFRTAPTAKKYGITLSATF
jgi:hypothetical protein